MPSRRFGSVRFVAYPQDHLPRHVHGFTGETEVIVDLLENRSVSLADRKDGIKPANTKRNDVKLVLRKAAEHFDALVALWEEMHDENG